MRELCELKSKKRIRKIGTFLSKVVCRVSSRVLYPVLEYLLVRSNVFSVVICTNDV